MAAHVGIAPSLKRSLPLAQGLIWGSPKESFFYDSTTPPIQPQRAVTVVLKYEIHESTLMERM